MRRHGNLFQKIVTTENIYIAYRKARKGKRWQRKVQTFEKDLDNNIENIRQSLINKTFHTSGYRTKMIHEPKEREIFIHYRTDLGRNDDTQQLCLQGRQGYSRWQQEDDGVCQKK
jgi:hypothetical protein